jgi:ferredoxin--NADP+ reductase
VSQQVKALYPQQVDHDKNDIKKNKKVVWQFDNCLYIDANEKVITMMAGVIATGDKQSQREKKDRSMGKELNSIVTQRIEVNPGLIKLRVVPEGWELPDFTPGQFGVLGLPWTAPRHESADQDMQEPKDPNKLILRAYSVASSSVAKEYLEFYVGIVRSGALSPRLFAMKVGDRMWLSPRFKGMFTLSEVPREFNVALIATGTGVAPYISMIRTEVAEGFRHRFAVIHGAYHSSDLGYHEELKMLDSASPTFTYMPIISHPQEEVVDWNGPVGFVQKLWTDGSLAAAWDFHPTPENTHVFLCGNPFMIDDVTKLLEGEGFQQHTKKNPGQIHVEKFFVK